MTIRDLTLTLRESSHAKRRQLGLAPLARDSIVLAESSLLFALSVQYFVHLIDISLVFAFSMYNCSRALRTDCFLLLISSSGMSYIHYYYFFSFCTVFFSFIFNTCYINFYDMIYSKRTRI